MGYKTLKLEDRRIENLQWCAGCTQIWHICCIFFEDNNLKQGSVRRPPASYTDRPIIFETRRRQRRRWVCVIQNKLNDDYFLEQSTGLAHWKELLQWLLFSGFATLRSISEFSYSLHDEGVKYNSFIFNHNIFEKIFRLHVLWAYALSARNKSIWKQKNSFRTWEIFYF